ncbi:MAG: tetratricopeptide repeat protein [Caldilineaceae bacterium]|nr:tetratricopeptide repeat protein [Caldilineaceae bacterium]
MTQTAGLRIHLLGPLRIERDAEVIHLPRRKVEALLAYLLLHPQPQTRDALATLFWDDTSDDKARHSLRTALATLRQHLSDSLLLVDRNHVQIDPSFPLWLDLRELLALDKQLEDSSLAEPTHLRAALALWQGELLTGFYDNWVAAVRQHYHARLFKLLLTLAQALRARSEYSLAIEVAHKVLDFDAANEHAHQHLMFCYMAAGDRAAALRQYEQCEAALETELDASPAAETTALYLWIKQQESKAGSAYARITNLPIPLTSFVGRARQTSDLKRLLDPAANAARLVTLLGAGGSGKTRLAIQVATDLIDSYAHGVWWVDLATLTDSDQVARAVAKALGVSEVAAERCTRSIMNALKDKTLLLVLDNCEHLIKPSAQLAVELLSHCPNLQILTTSREPLNISGEILWQTPALSLPDLQQLPQADLLMQYECVRLFVERAAASQQSFRLTPENAPSVAEICIRLDGMPLAIELAAARVKMLTVEEISDRLTGVLGARFVLLTQGSRTALPRHQTLRAAIDWSYALLDPAERQLFRQTAIFRGGFTLDALEQIAEIGAPGHSSSIPSGLDLLTQLVDKSLVIVEPHGAQHRYRLLETLREYALEQFSTSEELTLLQARHAAFFLAFAEQAEPELVRAQQHTWLNRLEIEHPNLRAALDYLLANADSELALRLATALHRFWEYRGYVSEGRDWLRKALTTCEATTGELVAKALTASGWLAYRQGELEQGRRFLQESLHLFQQAEDGIGMVGALQILSVIEMDQGDYPAAQQCLEQSLSLAHALNDEVGIARGLKYAGGLAWDQDRIAEARDHYRESLHRYQRLGDQVSIANLLLNVGDTERLLHDVVAAQANYEECLKLARILGHKGLIGAALKSLGMLAFKREDYEQARGYGEDALAILRELGDRSHIAFALSNLADVARKLGDYNQALLYFSQNLQIMHEVGYKWPIFYCLEDIASLLAEVDQHLEAAVRFLGAAASLRQETGIPVAPDQLAAHEHLLIDLRQRLGERAFETHWQEGQHALLDQIVAEVTRLRIAA